MRPVLVVGAFVVFGPSIAHPGNGIVALSADVVITGDAVGSGIWRFTKGVSRPERVAKDFHCHWVTKGADGRIYAENLQETGGARESGVYRLDSSGGNPEHVLHNRNLPSSTFTANNRGDFLFRHESGLYERTVGGYSRLWKRGSLGEIHAYVWDGPRLYMADGDLIRSVSTNESEILVNHRVSGTVVDALYSGPNRSLKIWGLAVGPRREIYAAVPALSKVIRIEPDGTKHTLATGHDGWQPVGVSTFGADVFVLESKTVDRENYGPRVRVIRKDGRIEDLGEVTR